MLLSQKAAEAEQEITRLRLGAMKVIHARAFWHQECYVYVVFVYLLYVSCATIAL
jgi:hypothetical protein